MEIYGGESCTFEIFHVPDILRHLDPVRCQLDLGKSDLLCLSDQIHQVIPHGRFPSRELDCRRRDWFFGPEQLHHLDDLVKRRFVDESACPGIGKTEVAVEVTPVCQIDIGEQRPGFVKIAEAAVLRAGTAGIDHIRVLNAPPHGVKLLELMP